METDKPGDDMREFILSGSERPDDPVRAEDAEAPDDESSPEPSDDDESTHA